MADLFRPIPMAYEPMKKTRQILRFRGKNRKLGSFVTGAIDISSNSFCSKEHINLTLIDKLNSVDSKGDGNSMNIFTSYQRIVEKQNEVFNIVIECLDPTGVPIRERDEMLVRIINTDFEESQYFFNGRSTQLNIEFIVERIIRTIKRRVLTEKI